MLRWIWRLYPRSFRDRFGEELERDLELRGATGRPTDARTLLDALGILVRAWLDVATRGGGAGPLVTDLTLAARSLRRAPGYAFAVVTILALALGANTAVFAVTHAVLLRALPYGAPDRVHAIQPSPLTLEGDTWIVDPDFEALPQVEAAALYVDGGGANLELADITRRVTLAQVTEGFFDVLGVPPVLGRVFDPGETDAVVLSHDLWVRAFAADPDVPGRPVDLNGRSYLVAGVMPHGVEFPSAVDLWLPFPTDFEFYSNAIGPSAFALLGPGVSPGAVRTILEERREARSSGEGAPPPGLRRPPVTVTPLREELTGAVRTPLWVLMGIAGLVVVLGCLNLAGLVMSRTARRMDSLSVRRALGASRGRLFSQLITEILILSAVAGVVGLGAASVTADLLTRMLPAETPGLADVAFGVPVILFAGALAILAGFVVGTLPSLHGAWSDERPRNTRSSTDGRSQRRIQAALVAGQVAVAAALVMGASLLGRSLRNLEAVPLGYDLESVLTFRVQLPTGAYPDQAARGAYLANLEDAILGVPGVVAAGATTLLPQQEAMAIGLRLVPDGVEATDVPFAIWVRATSGYFAAIGMEPLRGVPFDRPGSGRWDRVAISEALADAIFPDREAVGARADIDWGRDDPIPTSIAAVMRNVRLRSRHGEPSRVVFSSMEAAPPAALAFAVRAETSPALLAERIRKVVLSVDPSVPPFDLTTTGQAAAREIATERAIAILSGLFGVSALVLAGLGLYGLVAQGLVRRRREFGIRLVLGAPPNRLVRSALIRPLALAALGLLLGVGLALWATSLLASLLFGVSPRDPVTLSVVVAGVLVVTALAAWLPARRIVRIDPAESLQAE